MNSRMAIVIVVIIFLLTIAVSYLLPGYSIVVGGFLLGIFFTSFINGSSSTFFAGGVAVVILLVGFFLFHKADSAIPLTELIFKILLVVFSSMAVTYLKNLNQNIYFDRTHMSSLFENATEGIILTNTNGEIVLVNPAAEKMFGYTAGELIGQKIEILIPHKYRKGHVQLRESFHQAPSNRVMGHGRDLFASKKTGEQFPVEVSLSHYKRHNQSYVIAFVINITERKAIEASMVKQQEELEKITRDVKKLNTELETKVEERTIILKEALGKLEQSQQELSEALDKERELNEIKSRFVSMASHEFRTPLSTILSSAALAGKYTTTEDQEKRTRHIIRIKESVKHLNDILEDFLSLGRLNEGKVAAQPGEFNLPVTVKETIDELRGLLKKDQDIHYNHNGDEKIISDKKLVKNILINLLSNAIKFSNECTFIRLNSSVKNDSCVISVADQGIGISEEDQEHLFSSFFRGKNAMNIQGTGLGLHIVDRYVKLLGGEVQLESELGKGTTITFSIPTNTGYEQNHPSN